MACGTVAFVLHAHLPDLRTAGSEDTLEERWLFDALSDTYVPLLALFDGLEGDGVAARLTLSVSPTLAAMLDDPDLPRRYGRHLERLARLAAHEVDRQGSATPLGRLASDHVVRLAATAARFFDAYGGRPLVALGHHARTGRVELLTTGATHAVLPLHLASPPWVRSQIALAMAEHARVFGSRPRGFWLPECAYDPALDPLLRAAGVEHVVLDTHGLLHATPQSVHGPWAPVASRAGVIALGRDPETALQVWNADVGFPADPWYRDYHRDLGWELAPNVAAEFLPQPPGGAPTGIKYHRVTGHSGPKALYEPERARARVEAQAAAFVARLAVRTAALSPKIGQRPIFVCPYDAELFGHWWFEGPAWLDRVLRLVASHPALAAGTLADAIASAPALQQVDPAASTWGMGGHLETWLAPEITWIYPALHALGVRVAALCDAASEREPAPEAVASTVEHLLLAQASDWPFMVARDTAAAYGRRRLTMHLDACRRLCDALERGQAPRPHDLRAVRLFPSLDPRRPDDGFPLSHPRPIP